MQTVWDKKSTSWVTARNICTIWPLISADSKCRSCMISSFSLNANEICALLRFSTGWNGNSVLIFQYNLSRLQGSSSLLFHTWKNFFNFQSYCNRKLQHLAVCNLWNLWHHSFCYAIAFKLKGLTIRSFLCLREKETVLSGRVWKYWETKNAIYDQRSEVHGQCPHGDTVSEQWMAMESPHGDTASIQQIVRESSHSDTASVQQMVREPSHGKKVSR